MNNPATSPITGYAGPATTQVQQYWLDVAWRGIKADVPDLVARAESNPELLAIAADVVTAAARRVLRNPEGNEAETGSIDDYTESWKRSDSTEDVYFTTAELRRLAAPNAPTGGWSGSVKYL